jgi:hypothetical protein
MKKTEFFTADDTAQLQRDVNTWLYQNKEIGIIETGMTTLSTGVKSSINFYILYEAMENAASVDIAREIENMIAEPDPSLSETSDAQLQ